MKTLTRIDFNKCNDLAKKAEEELGYAPDSDGWPFIHQDVVDALKTAGIRPYAMADVEAYKRKKAQQENTPVHLLYCACIATIIAVFIAGFYYLPAPQNGYVGPIFASIVLLPILAAIAALVVYTNLMASWCTIRISEYTRQVPPYVIETALSVKRALSNIEHYFRVDVLARDHEALRNQHNVDPFLVVEIRHKSRTVRLWLEVWDEPTFGKPREV